MVKINRKTSKKYRSISINLNAKQVISKSVKNERKVTIESTSSVKYQYHPSEIKYRDLPKIPNLLKPDLKLMFCGFNPGIQSSITGHRYAHFTNLFWPLMIESGIFDPINIRNNHDKELDSIKDIAKLLNRDNAEQYLFDNFEIGFTDLVDRPTKNISELSKEEMEANVPKLIEKIEKYRPKIICFIGKDIFKKLYRYTAQNSTDSKIAGNFDKLFKWGSQDYFEQFNEAFNYKVLKNDASAKEQNNVNFFVMPSTSGLVASIPRSFKLQLFQELKKRFIIE